MHIRSPETPYERSLLGFYCYTWAVEVFSCVSITVFLPVVLEQLAREHGFRSTDHLLPCNEIDAAESSATCSVQVLGIWVESTSFSLYVKSASVAVQALVVISMSSLADIAFWRKRLLLTFACIGAASAVSFIILPTTNHVSLYLAAILAIGSTVAFGGSFVCLNAFLPSVVRASPEVQAMLGRGSDQGDTNSGEATSLLWAGGVDMESVAIVLNEDVLGSTRPDSLDAASTISQVTSRISSTGIALGYTSGVSVLILTIIPVTIMRGSSLSLRLAIFASGVWWAIFTIPAARWLLGGDQDDQGLRGGALMRRECGESWRKLGEMVKGSEVRRLPSTYWYLLAWALLADAFNTTTSIAILFGRATLSMSASHVILIGILSQSTAVFSAYLTPVIQRKYGWTSMRMLLISVAGVFVLCVYGMVGLIPGVKVGGLRTEGEMYGCAVWFGIMFGPFMSTSRTVFAELIPEGHEARFFSLFSICDKGASWIGPGTIAILSDLTGEIRYGFVFLAMLLVVPVPILLCKVDVGEGRKEAGVYAREERREL